MKMDAKAWHMSYINGEPAEQAVIDDEMEKRKINDTFNFEVDYTSSISVDQIEAINKLALNIIKHKKITIACYGGVVAGTAYSTFAGSKFRLATKTTVFYIPELGKYLLYMYIYV
jgi:enoyl-CoA hydratase/carnithine racemase